MATELVPEGAKALLFDIDGTLLDTSGQRVRSWQAAAGKRGLSISREEYLAFTGMKGRDLVDKLCADQGKDLTPEQRQDVVDTESDVFQDQGMKQVKPVDIVMRVIEEGRKRQLPMGIVSGGEPQVVDKALDDANLGDTFKVVVSSKDVEHAKPAPDIYLLAAEKIGVDPGSCVAYEDAPLGLESARRAGYLGVVDVTALDEHPEHGMKDGAGGRGIRGHVEGRASEVM